MSPLCSLRERTALCNCFTAEQVDLIQLLLCSCECNTEDLRKTNIIFFHLKGWFLATKFKSKGWLGSNWCLCPGLSCSLISIPGVREAGSWRRYRQCRHWRSGQSFSKAGADTNSKSKVLACSGWLLNVFQNTHAYHANSNKRQKDVEMKLVAILSFRRHLNT